MGWIVFGVILLVIGIVAICMRQLSSQKRLDQLTRSGRQKIGEIVAAYQATKQDLGEMGEENTVGEEMTVMGMPKCDSPLISPLGQKECLYYEMRVTAERIEHYTDTDSDGNTRQKTRRVTDTLDSSSNNTRFTLEDSTGSVLVDPRDGVFEDLVTTVDRSETYVRSNSSRLSFGGFSLDLCNFNQYCGNTMPQTIKYEEKIIGLDRKVTVVGTLCDKMGDLMIQKNGKTKVIVSTKSPEEMVLAVKGQMKTQLIVAIACGAIGLILCIIGAVSSI